MLFVIEANEETIAAIKAANVSPSKPFGRSSSIIFGYAVSEFWTESVGNNKAARAVGTANAKNPLPIIIPCHRIISSNDNIGGYSGGLDKKLYLLDHESNLFHQWTESFKKISSQLTLPYYGFNSTNI